LNGGTSEIVSNLTGIAGIRRMDDPRDEAQKK